MKAVGVSLWCCADHDLAIPGETATEVEVTDDAAKAIAAAAAAGILTVLSGDLPKDAVEDDAVSLKKLAALEPVHRAYYEAREDLERGYRARVAASGKVMPGPVEEMPGMEALDEWYDQAGQAVAAGKKMPPPPKAAD